MGRANQIEIADFQIRTSYCSRTSLFKIKTKAASKSVYFGSEICRLNRPRQMTNQLKFSALRERFRNSPVRPKGLRFFSELGSEAQKTAVSEESESGRRFDWDDAEFLTEDFKTQLAELGFEETEVYWSLGYCQGDGVAFYGRVYAESLKEKDSTAERLIDALDAAGDALYIEITGASGHYHHWNSMTVEIEFESESEDEDLPARLKIARPALRENLEEYLAERVKEISRELEKSGYAEIEYRFEENVVREELAEREHLYEKDGSRAMNEFEFYEWKQAYGSMLQSV